MNMGEERKQIKISESTRELLKAMGKKGESYDEIILKLLKRGEQNGTKSR